ncbi:MAG: ribosome small subunit-dependent GTPase A [Actinobacteria bacterium]|nr:ribosome small subunit-dependent GTPase A [Actinomycetota bacterium]
MSVLKALGWNEFFAEGFTSVAPPGTIPGRVAVPHRGAHDVLTELGELRCDVAGRLYDEASSPAERPVVGDWVAVVARADERAGTITAVLPRRTKFSRKTAWQATEEQVLAANIDVVFIVTSLNEDLNLRRLERYLILARESGARPVLLLTKSDLTGDIGARVAAVEAIAVGIPIHAISSRTGEGLDDVRAYLTPGVTAALLGSSGVGKSTLANALLGEELFATNEIRDDGRGRHTTARRELVQLPGGGLLIDTPGMRELQLWIADDGLEEAFEDVTSLFEHCRFSDCSHESEPGCAVKAALADGTLATERWESYLSLQAELAHLERRIDNRAQSEERKRWRSVAKLSRNAARAKGRRT